MYTGLAKFSLLPTNVIMAYCLGFAPDSMSASAHAKTVSRSVFMHWPTNYDLSSCGYLLVRRRVDICWQIMKITLVKPARCQVWCTIRNEVCAGLDSASWPTDLPGVGFDVGVELFQYNEYCEFKITSIVSSWPKDVYPDRQYQERTKMRRLQPKMKLWN